MLWTPTAATRSMSADMPALMMPSLRGRRPAALCLRGAELYFERHKQVLEIMVCMAVVVTAMVAGSCNTPTQQPETAPSVAPQPLTTQEPEPGGKKYIWYVGYGSNLCQERFFCYIKGGQYKFGGSNAQGCGDKTLPRENKAIELPYRLYFARQSSSWDKGGVAFIHGEIEKDKTKWTLARMWKITEEQFQQVRQQEGLSWYNHVIDLGAFGDIPVLAITSGAAQTLNPPSGDYLSTIIIGLIESYELDADEVYNYLYRKEGIQGYFSEKELRDIVDKTFAR